MYLKLYEKHNFIFQNNLKILRKEYDLKSNILAEIRKTRTDVIEHRREWDSDEKDE